MKKKKKTNGIDPYVPFGTNVLYVFRNYHSMNRFFVELSHWHGTKDKNCKFIIANIPIITLNMETTARPNDGFVNSNDHKQMTGVIAKLYTSKIKTIVVNSSIDLKRLCCPSISIGMISRMINIVVIMSHKIDTPQKIHIFAPLTYCMNLALHCFSCFDGNNHKNSIVSHLSLLIIVVELETRRRKCLPQYKMMYIWLKVLTSPYTEQMETKIQMNYQHSQQKYPNRMSPRPAQMATVRLTLECHDLWRRTESQHCVLNWGISVRHETFDR